VSGLIDPDAPYPDGCGPDCKGCDLCVCGHPWSQHTDGRDGKRGCLDASLCTCTNFNRLYKMRIYYPSAAGEDTGDRAE